MIWWLGWVFSVVTVELDYSKTRSHYVAQAILWPCLASASPECWDCEHVPPHLMTVPIGCSWDLSVDFGDLEKWMWSVFCPRAYKGKEGLN